MRFTNLLGLPRGEAIVALADEYKRTGEVPTLRNLTLLLLDVGKWQFAKENCRVLTEACSCDADFISSGMVDWFMGDQSSAMALWRIACDAEYTDIVGPIDGPLVLWYAGRRLDDKKLIEQSLTMLKRFWRNIDYREIDKWPGTQAIAGFLLGEVPVDTFLRHWTCNAVALEHRRSCRANFWMGMTMIETAPEKGIEYFFTAYSKSNIAMLQYEYFLAKWEYSRLTNRDLWA